MADNWMTISEPESNNSSCPRIGFFVFAVTLGLFGTIAAAAENTEVQRAAIEFFESKIRPVLVQECYGCHSAQAETLEGGLYLDSRNGMRQGGESGPVLVPGHPEQSLLIAALRYQDFEMPPDDPLSDEVIADFTRWIQMGAPDPREPDVPVQRSDIVWEEARQFWSYRRPVKPALPTVRHQDQIRSPIDAFVLQQLEGNGLSLNPQADRRTLIRRAYFDLIGLPPTPEQVAAFLSNSSPNAYDQLVDRLLGSPHYGERWGRHWLDVAGYAESNGIIGDGLIPHAWKYRDYVIRALNKDKPYDRFLLEQFAGDELVDWRNAEEMTEPIVEALTATGFLRCTPDGTDNQDIYQLEKRWDHLHATVEVALKVSLGMILNCARCHDHKFDAIPQEDYYRVLALFQPAYDPDNWIPCTDFKKLHWPVRYLLKAGKSQREQTIEALTRLGRRVKELQSESRNVTTPFHDRWLIDKAHTGALLLHQDQLAALKAAAEQRTIDQQRIVADLRAQHAVSQPDLEQQFPELKKRIQQIDQQIKDKQEEIATADCDRIWALWDVSSKAPVTRLLRRGDFMSPGRAVAPGIPTVLDDPEDPFVLPQPGDDSTWRRLTFARWLVRPQHPLTARVMVNRVWHYHFGRGIVATPDDFGTQGARPTHPALLDWLATWFVEHGWSVKELHRLIMTAAVYRQSAAVDGTKLKIDPDNTLLSRRTPRRLEAEIIRDAMLAVAGNLDATMFGPPVSLKKMQDGQYVVNPDDPGSKRRSVYIRVRRTTPVSFLETFDAPEMDTNVPHRFSSTVPLQSLSLMNNPFVVDSAQRFALRLKREVPHDAKRRIERAFRIAYARSPTHREIEMSLTFVQDNSADEEQWALFCHGLIASNEFLYVN